MRVACIRFTKRQFCLGWSFKSYDIISDTDSESSSDYLFSSEEDSKEEHAISDENVGPDDDDLGDIVNTLMVKSIELRNKTKDILATLEHNIDAVKNDPSIKNINALHEFYLAMVPEDGKYQ